MSEELKPCPFCGGEAKIWQSGGSSEVDGYTTHHVVGCSKCGVSRQYYSKPYTGPKPEEAIPLAISLWNTRSESSQARLSEAVKVLEAISNAAFFIGREQEYYMFPVSVMERVDSFLATIGEDNEA